jgi:hypothetical protein
MCVALGGDNASVVATGFVGGENSTTGYVDDRERQIGGSGGSLEPPGSLLEPPGHLLTHLHTVYI